jgi:hypothetical protein
VLSKVTVGNVNQDEKGEVVRHFSTVARFVTDDNAVIRAIKKNLHYLLDHSGSLEENSLYIAVCNNRLAVFEKLVNLSELPNVPAQQDVLDNIFSVLKIIIETSRLGYFKVLFPYWQKLLSPENSHKERSRFEKLIREQKETSRDFLRLIVEDFHNHGLSLLLAKQGLFTTNEKEVLPPELAKHILQLAIQSAPGFR